MWRFASEALHIHSFEWHFGHSVLIRLNSAADLPENCHPQAQQMASPSPSRCEIRLTVRSNARRRQSPINARVIISLSFSENWRMKFAEIFRKPKNPINCKNATESG